MTRDRLFRWIVRAVFWCGFVYVYFAVYRQPVFKPYTFLLPNLFLAYIPIELSFHLEETTPRLVFWPIFAVWFFFYPNAPYMLTDFFHLALRNPYIVRADGTRTGLLMPDMKMWLVFLDLAACALVSTFVGIHTLHRTAAVLLRRVGCKSAWWQAAVVLAFTVIASVGIYIGRFPRLHTAHIVTKPYETAKCIATLWDMRLATFTVILTATQMFVWGLLMLVRLPPSRHEGGGYGILSRDDKHNP